MAKGLRVALSGCGKAGKAQLHWFARHPDCEIVALYDPNAESAAACTAQYGAVALPSWEALARHPQVELISLCGPESLRCSQALQALENGKHVLCEKPFANSLDECDAMLAAARRHGRALLAFFNMRFHPVVAAVDASIDEVGSLYAARFSYTQFRTAVNWRHKLEQGGGVLKSQGVHAIDLALRWLGPARSVSGELAIIHPAREVEDFALINLRFANGAVGEVYAAYTDRQPEAMTAALQGTRGKINFCLSPYQPAMNQVSISRQGETKAVALSEHAALDPVYPGLLDCSQRAIAHIVDGLLNGRPSSLDGAAGRRSIEIVLAGYESQRRGTKVRLPLASFEGTSLADCFPRFDAGPYDLQE
ncbi:MAG: Gfo/Idh/MocA family oxidoreductase [Chloroflexota bacterium]|nr:Gfo/Idh/MocA family oxidoreductase [Chloroflexota bacterium]MDE2945791.1 Gfo/Idh/MocA family oxidoreductase [Chloroflexota bacterium]